MVDISAKLITLFSYYLFDREACLSVRFALLKVIYNTSVTIAVMYFVLNTAYLKSTIALG
jgi:hypothetical protein